MVKDKERKVKVVSVYMYVNFDFVIYIVVICDVRGWKKFMVLLMVCIWGFYYLYGFL